MKKEIGKKIKEVREAKGLSQYAVGKKAGIQQVIVRNIESGNTAYSVDSFLKILNALDIIIDVNGKFQEDYDAETLKPCLKLIGYSIIITDKTPSVDKLLPNEQIEEETK